MINMVYGFGGGKNLTPKFPQMENGYPPNLKNQKSEILAGEMNFPPKIKFGDEAEKALIQNSQKSPQSQ